MSKFFINRPIVAMVISIIMVIIGAVCILSLPIAQFPNIADPLVQVKGTYPGADATTVAQSVATPIEQQMSGVDNMNYMYSTSANNGSMTLTIDFNVKTDPNTDLILSQLRQAQSASQMPAAVTAQGVTVEKSNSAPLMLFALYSPTGQYDAKFITNYAYINLNYQLTRVPGIASVTIYGAGQYAMRIWVDPNKLASLGITVTDVVNALQTQNNVNPAGQIGGEPVPPGQVYTYTVRTQGYLTSPDQFGQIVVRANPDGSVVRVRDVARVELGTQYYNITGRFNGKPSAIIALYQLPDTNALQAANGAKKLMEEAKKNFPPGLDYAVSLDTTKAVTAGMEEIVKTLIEALILVVIVVFIFLQGWRATLIPLLAVPVSLVGTFAVFPLFGFSINTLSLFGLVLAIGLVVDDAIVVVEAVELHIEEGLSPKDAAFKAMEQVTSPVIGIALILTAVFVPTAFIPGITGLLYQQFALTIAISVLISAFNALTLSPALCALLLKPKTESHGLLARGFGLFNRGFTSVTHGYVNFSRLLIRRCVMAMIVLGLIALGAGYIGSKLPTSFLPDEDQGYIYGSLQLPDASSLQRTSDAAKEMEHILLNTPGVEYVTTVCGFNLLSGVQDTYNAFFFITLKDWKYRTAPREQYSALKKIINLQLYPIPQGQAFIFPPPAIPGVGSSGGYTMVLEDRVGNAPSFLDQNLKAFLDEANKRPELSHPVMTTALPVVPQVGVNVDRDKVLKLKISLGDVYQTMQCFMGGAFVNYFNLFGLQWQTYVEAEGAYRTVPENIGQFYVRNSQGQSVPMSSITSIDHHKSGPEFVMRYNLYNCAQIFGSPAEGYSAGQATAALEDVFKKTQPQGMGYDYMGMSYQEQVAAQGVSPAVIFGLSLLFVFLILAALYESWSLPFSVLLATPVAVFGAMLTLHLRHMDNDVYAQIGLVMLIGLSAKNAILIVEFARMQLETGKMSIAEAALEGARLRLRPILMTSFAFILGCVPLWLATGSGALSRQILGSAVIGGMLASSIIAIFLVPVTFFVVEKLNEKKEEKKEPIAPTTPEAPAA
jgi:HAE1 family hydrophobic/amphiphilic exporter-1